MTKFYKNQNDWNLCLNKVSYPCFILVFTLNIDFIELYNIYTVYVPYLAKTDAKGI